MSHSKDWRHRKTLYIWMNAPKRKVGGRQNNGTESDSGIQNNTRLRMEENRWRDLNQNVLCEVVKRLGPKDYIACMLVCKAWQAMLMQPYMRIKPQVCFVSLEAPVKGAKRIRFRGRRWYLQRSQVKVPFPAPQSPFENHGCINGTLIFSLEEREKKFKGPITCVNLGDQAPGCLLSFHLLSPLDLEWLTLTPLRLKADNFLLDVFMCGHLLVAILFRMVAIIDILKDTCRVVDSSGVGARQGKLGPLVAGGKLYIPTKLGLMCLCLNECTWAEINVTMPSGVINWVEVDGDMYLFGDSLKSSGFSIWVLDLQTSSWNVLADFPRYLMYRIYDPDYPKIITVKSAYGCIILTFKDEYAYDDEPSEDYPLCYIVTYHVKKKTWNYLNHPRHMENFDSLIPFTPMTWIRRPHAEVFAR